MVEGTACFLLAVPLQQLPVQLAPGIVYLAVFGLAAAS
jgi:hypothetical protein